MGKVPDKYLAVEPWKLIEDGFHPGKTRVSESLFTLANEHMGVRAYFDEGFSGDTLPGCYLNGIFERQKLKEPLHYKGIPDTLCFMVNTVDWLHTRIVVDGETLNLANSKISGFRRELNFRTGELARSFVWETKSGKSLKMEFRRFLSMTVNELGCQSVRLEPVNNPCTAAITLGLDFSMEHESYQKNYWDVLNKGGEKNSCAILGQTLTTGQKLFAGFVFSGCTPEKTQFSTSEKFSGCSFELNLEKGKVVSIDKISVISAARKAGAPENQVWEAGQKALATHGARSYKELLKENEAYWDKAWSLMDIEIEGDDETQQGIRYCVFQMQQTYRGAVEKSNIGAKGLSGEVYNGNAFWDTETYCLPFFLFNNPGAARALLDFRYETLPQAMERAKQLDCQGACYPVATIDGNECCTLWQHANLQFQPTTAVAFALEHYVRITQDAGYLHSKGAEMLVQICRFLGSRGQWSGDGKRFGYYAVMGPDEFKMMVNNNCYTNFMARQSFRYALGVIKDLAAKHPQKLKELEKKTGLSAQELLDWDKKAEAMYIPQDRTTGVFEQHEGFFSLPHIDIHSIPVTDFPLYHHWSYDRIYRNDIVKQPDVLMFIFLYNQSFSLKEKQANYQYYEPRCIHESSLSPSVHSILACELGMFKEAYGFFQFATRIDLDDYNRNAREGIHITSIAAAWMNILYGFGGLRSDGETLVLDPVIPEKWKSYSFRLLYRGSFITVRVDQNQAKIQVITGTPVKMKIRGEVRDIDQKGLVLTMKKGNRK